MKEANTFSEINLKVLIKKILKRKFLFAISLFLCLAAAFVYLKLAIPQYEVKTLLLIDPLGKSRKLGESKYVEGEVGQIGTEKNINNEMATIKTYNLVNKAIKQLDFEVSYYSGSWYKKEERYNNSPFKVEIDKSGNQLFGAFFKVQPLNDAQFQLSVEAKDFTVGNPSTKLNREVKKEFEFSETFSYGEEIKHNYFNFTLQYDSLYQEELPEQELFFKIHSEEGLTKSYLAKIEVIQIDLEASILRIKSFGPVLKKEIIFLKKLTSIFINSKLQERNEIASHKERFLKNQLKLAADSLAIAERNLEIFQQGENAVDLTKSASNALDELQKLESSRGQIVLNVKYYYTMINYLEDGEEIDRIIAPSVVGIDDPLLNENLLDLKRLNSQKVDLNLTKGPQAPEFRIIDQQIDNATKSLKENLKSLVRSSELALRDINQRIGGLEATINKLPGRVKHLAIYKRKSTLNENLYNYLSQELAKTAIARAENFPDTKVLDPPRIVGNGPFSPQKKLIAALAVFVGLLIPFLWIVFMDLFNESQIDNEALDSLSPLPIAGKIDGVKNGATAFNPQSPNLQVEESFRNLSANLQFLTREKDNNLNGFNLESTNAPTKESFGDLSTNLQFLSREKDKKVIGITSKKENAGKTFCATNLSLSLAKEGKKILLIDLNFRHPGIASTINGETEKDLSGYLKQESDKIEEIIYIYKDLPNLHYIPTFADSTNPNNLILSKRLNSLISTLRLEYDYLILDTPAFGSVSDYLLISRFVDIHLFVLRKDTSKLSYLSDIEKLVERGKMESAFLIFNGFNKRF